jgi:oligosaccharyltransferase complex subunit gamma
MERRNVFQVNQPKLKLLLTYFLIFTTLISFTLCHPKGDELRTRTKNSDNGVIAFNANDFKEFVLKHPRPYDVVVLFTLKYKCKLCESVTEEFLKAAESYQVVDGQKPDMALRRRAVFFGILYYSDETSQIFKNLKLPSTTSILYTAPSNIQLDDNNEPFIKYDEDFVIGYKERTDLIFAHKMLEFINAKSGRKVELKKNPIVFLFYFICFLFILAAGFYLFNNFKQFFLSPYLWLVGSLLVYIICIGGIVYNIIHGTPFAKFDRYGNIVELIHTGQRSQYVGEGLLLSSLFVMGGIVMMAFIWINKITSNWQHRIATLVLIFLMVVIFRVIISIYQKKASWYGPTFFPPYGYTKGPLIKDQGNSF